VRNRSSDEWRMSKCLRATVQRHDWKLDDRQNETNKARWESWTWRLFGDPLGCVGNGVRMHIRMNIRMLIRIPRRLVISAPAEAAWR